MYTSGATIAVYLPGGHSLRLKAGLWAAGLAVLLAAGCDNQSTGPDDDNGLPDKLGPYETFYDKETFQQRRDRLVSILPGDALAVITTSDTYLRNGDIDYDFRPASNFFYLTGFEEPNAVAVIRKTSPEVNLSEFIMFVEQRSGSLEQWLGPVVGPEGAVEYYYADSAYGIGNFVSYITAALGTDEYASVYGNFAVNPSLADSFYSSGAAIPPVFDLDAVVDTMRVVKTAIEISSIRKAVDVSVQAFTEGLEAIEPGMYEYEVEAIFGFVAGLNGCPRLAFPTIVASGPNINTLHYDANVREMLDGELVMIDFGAEYGYYAADVTRTVPVNGKFSDKQAAVYQVVLDAHQAVIEAAAPGVSYYYLKDMARDMVIDGLLEKGIITGNKVDIIESQDYQSFIPAGLGHCVGLDVHDPFPRNASGDKILRENMVLAIEPHIYLYEDDPQVNPDYHGIAARIEDDILITADGCQVLSSALPSTIAGIEELME
ncbi:MAG: aminopeptidase P family protein [Candidatus Marinimicrobia bacterium]|nr:aminopeptidase P family protein [Candidatus Neomarinimicrobiota bacterium]